MRRRCESTCRIRGLSLRSESVGRCLLAVVGFAVATLAACAPTRSASPRPAVEIQVLAEDDTVEFRFRACETREPQPVREVYVGVRRSNGKYRQHCLVTSEQEGGLGTSWQYGSPLPEGTVTRGCEPLSPGEYLVDVEGVAWGSQAFRLEPGGRVELQQGRCPAKSGDAD